MFEGAFRFLSEWGREMRNAGRIGRASKLLRRARLVKASELLKRVRASSPPLGDGPRDASVFSTRVVADKMLSMIAAKLGDTETALDCIREGLPLWHEVEPHVRSEPTKLSMREWEAWAKRYTDAIEGEPPLN